MPTPDNSHGPADFISRPGLPGPFGALMDETARAAEDLCRLVETIPAGVFVEERESADPDTRSIQAICTHCVRAARGYANYIRTARGLPVVASDPDPGPLPAPEDLRRGLKAALRYTERSLEGLYDASEDEVTRLSFQVRWGPTYDPEMILEHGIVHLLRHRRQIERWLSPAARPPGLE